MTDGEPYSGLVGAYRYAFRRSGSVLFRAYVLVSALVGAFVSLLLVFGLISWAATPGQFGERALLGVIGVLVLAPLFAPVLIVARRYRLAPDRPTGDRSLALSGVGFLAAIFLMLFISDPESHAAPAPLDAIVAVLDSLPAIYALVPPVASALGIYLAVRVTRSGADGDGDTGPDQDGDTEPDHGGVDG